MDINLRPIAYVKNSRRELIDDQWEEISTKIILAEEYSLVKNLDAIDGKPVLEINPVFKEFQPKGEIIQPDCVNDLMMNY